MTIRHATELDLDGVAECDPVARTDRQRMAFLTARVLADECWVYETEHRVLGFATLEYTFYENGFVSLLCVQEAARRRGIGSALMKHMRGICSTPKLFTSTNQSNGPMQSLLAICGFEPSGVIYNLDDDDPELVFWQLR